MDQLKFLYVDKHTRSFADNLVAFGLATVVDELLDRQHAERPDVLLTYCGGYYQLACSPALDLNAIWELSDPLRPIAPIRGWVYKGYAPPYKRRPSSVTQTVSIGP